MVKPLWIIVGIVVIAFIVSSSAQMSESIQSIQFSLTSIAYSDEISEIQSAVKEFMKIRQNPYSEDSETRADKLDRKLNDLELVKTNCKEKISTLDLAKQQDPYLGLQQSCPILREVSFSQAVYMWSRFG